MGRYGCLFFARHGLSEDLDIFATIRNIGPDGKDVCEVGQHGQAIPCVMKGWLRALHPLPRGLQRRRRECDLRRRRQGVVSAAARHPAEKISGARKS